MAALHWKMMICPLLLLVLKMFKFQYDDPANRLLVRVLYGLSQIAALMCCGYISYKIRRGGDSTKTVQLNKGAAPGGDAETVSYQQYDFSQLRSLLTKLLTGVGVTTLIHVYMGVVPPLLVQTVMQPMTVFEHPLFSIYVLHKSADDDEKLKRPFPDNSPFAQQVQARASRVSNTVQSPPEIEREEDVQVDNGGEEHQEDVQQDVGASAVTSESQTTLSTIERRHPSLQSVEQ